MTSLQMFKAKKNPLDFSLEEWIDWALLKGSKPFLGKQIYDWIYAKGVIDPKGFSNISKAKQEDLSNDFYWSFMEIDSHLKSSDGSEKILLKTHDGHLIEMVRMPYEKRTTLCISCQVGCRIGCTFCQTGKMGLKRSLSSGEILYQILLANQMGSPVTNIVFMGMGEPLDNYHEVVKACTIMIDRKALALAQSRVTISTSGLLPEIEKLGRDLPVRLAISLHSAIEEKRSAMMPINRKYPLSEMKKVLLKYPAPSRYGITFEYVLIEGENDSEKDAKALVKFLHGLKAKVNLIPINNFPGIDMHPSTAESIRAFQLYLTSRSIPAPVRYSKGTDVSGGCGQLSAKRASEINDDPRVLHRKRRAESREQQSKACIPT